MRNKNAFKNDSDEQSIFFAIFSQRKYSVPLKSAETMKPPTAEGPNVLHFIARIRRTLVVVMGRTVLEKDLQFP